ncbi:MAG TPA: hypothetical protein EYN69_08325, partial [Flavobacteriales bacterium]|nr:hypothetical protein [Flavobacteriales bacterium]
GSISIYGSLETTPGTYYDSLNSVNGCDSVHSTVLTIDPDYNIVDAPVTVCTGGSISIYGTFESAAGTYYDSLTTLAGCDSIHSTVLTLNLTSSSTRNLVICPGDSLFVQGAYQNAAGTYIDTLTATNGCDSVVTTNLTVFSEISVQISNDTTIISGAAANLMASGGTTYSWSTGQVGSSISVSATSTTTYWVSVSDTNGCTNNAQVTVTVLPEEYAVYVPNVFSISSENMDHNRLYVFGRGVESLELVIYDRWGKKVYETNDASAAIRSDGQCCAYGIGWDGTYKQTGKPLNSAVFAYILTGFFTNGTAFSESGNITLIK